MLSARPQIAFLFLLILCLFTSLTGLQPARAQNPVPQDTAVAVTATVTDLSATPPPPLQITLNFPADRRATGYTISRKLITDAAFTQIATISGAAAATATSYVDRTVSVGIPYEYQVVKNSNVTGFGYVIAGITVPLPGATPANPTVGGSRGKIIVVAASDAVSDPRIAAGLNRLTQDLTGDGWTVISHTVGRDAGMNVAGVMNDRGAAVLALKQIIRNDYNADPTNVKEVLLFGHVPVAYSGEIAPDGHNNHVGAWPCDAYYGDMGPETSWTDTTVNNQTADNPRTRNVPGDGKFDQSGLPDPITLEVGRVDLADLPAFAPKKENDLLAQYLNKDHNYRTGFLNLTPAGRISDNFGYFGGEAFAQNGFRNFPAFYGPAAVTQSGPTVYGPSAISLGNPLQVFPIGTAGGQLFPDLDLGNFQWSYGCGGGGPTGAGGVGTTDNFAQNDPHSTFYMLFGSFFGDWGYGFDSGGNDFLRAPLATTTYGLSSSWGGRPNWSYYHMGLGFDLGFGARLTQNSSSATHAALMGDPTLRLNVVAPASGLSAAANGADVQVSWTASPQAQAPIFIDPTTGATTFGTTQPSPVIGYNVYRQDTVGSPFTLLNTSGLVTTTSYTDTGVGGLPHTYQVRAVCLQTTPSGTYYNQSQGVYEAYDSGHVAPTVTLVAPAKTVPGVIPKDPISGANGIAFIGNPTATMTLAADAASSIPNDPSLSVTFYLNGVALPSTTASPNPATALPFQYPNLTLPPGYYTLSAVATDGQGATTASKALPIYVYNIPEAPDNSDTGDINPRAFLSPIFNGALAAGYTDISDKSNNNALMADNLGGNPASVDLKQPGAAFVLSHTPIDTSLYPDLALSITLRGNNDPTKPGGQNLIITTPNQDAVPAVHVNNLPGFNQPSLNLVISLAGIVGAGERGRNFDGLNIVAANYALDNTGKVIPTPTFYISDIHLEYVNVRPQRAAGVAVHLDAAKFSVANQNNQPITAKGDASTPDGVVSEVDLFLSTDGGTTYTYLNRASGQGTTVAAPYSPYSSVFGTLTPGSYSLKANAITSFGTTSSSAAFPFTVVDLPTVAITSPANNAVFPTGSAFPITATATAATGANLTKVQFFYSLNGGTATEIGPDQTTGGPYQVAFTPPSVGSYVLTVVATDDAGGTATSAPVTVNVGDPPTITLNTPANGTKYVAPASFTASATATQGTNPITKVDFFAGSTLLGTATTATNGVYTFNVTGLAAGTYAITAKATDSIGLTATTSPPVTIVVNNPPTVSITAPANNAPFSTTDTFAVTASATAGSNPITQVQFFAGTTSLGTVAAPGPYTVSVSNLAAGTYQLTAVVTDSAGLTVTSAPVTIVVSAPPTVSITSPADGAKFVTSTDIPVTATAAQGTNPITQVQFFSNGTSIGTVAAPGPYTANFNTATAGTYTLTAVATDSTGLTTTSAPITITVNAPPTVSITAPADGTVYAAPATFTVTASATAGNNPITQVEFFSNGASLGIVAAPGPYTVNVSGLAAGPYSLTAKVTDSAGLTATSAVNVTVANPPAVAITAPTDGSTFVTGTPFAITASATAGTNPITKVDFFANGTLVGTATTAPYTFSFTPTTAGAYALTAVVTDSAGLTATSATVNVTVNTAPTVAITAPADGTKYVAPATFSITASVTQGTGTITKVDFFANGTLIGTATNAPYTFSFANVAAGTYALTAVVTDSAGLTATSATVTVTVNDPPTVVVTAPANNAAFTAPAAFTVTASATPGSNPITKVDFFLNGTTLIGTATAAPYTANVTGLAAGTYALTAVVTDSAGVTATSAAVTITVTVTPPQIAITAPAEGTAFVAPATFTIKTSTTLGSYPLTKVQFFANGTLVGTVTTAPYTFNFANVAAGTYALTAVATDSVGTTATSAPVNVTVNSKPTVSITAPIGGTVFTSPATFAVTATATAGSTPIQKVDFFANGKAIGTATTGTNGVYTVNVTGLAAGTYQLTAVATDGAGLTATSANVTVVVNAGPTVAITSPTDGSTFNAPTLIPITATATPGTNPISKVDFFASGQAIGTATTAPYTVNFNGATPGTYVLTARATDSTGQTSTSATVTITVNGPPTVTLTSPTNGAIFNAPATIPVTATATAGSNPITKVDFFVNGTTLIGTATTAPYTISFANVAAGAYSLTAVVTDSIGLTATSAAISITVVTAQPVYGLVTRSTDSSAVVGATLRFTDQGTGQITTVTTGQSGTGPDGKPSDYSLSGLASGTYTVSVSAAGYVAPATQTVRVTTGQALRVDFTLSPLHAFPSGLQMFSVPYDYSASGQSLSAILGIPNPRLVDWDPASSSYTVPTTFVLGMGYWARFPAGAGLVIAGTPAPTGQPFTKTLPAGWNIIGDPFLTSESWSHVQIAGANGTAVPLATAASQRLIGANLYTYNQSTNAYNSIPASSTTGSLDPYVGYWIFANGSVTLKVLP